MAHNEETASATVAGLVSFEGGTSESSSAEFAAEDRRRPGRRDHRSRPAGADSYGQRLSGDFLMEQPAEGETEGLPLQSILQTVKQVLSRFSGVMDALGRKSPAAVLRGFGDMLEKLGRPAGPAGANHRGAWHGANPGPGRTVPLGMRAPEPDSTPAPGRIEHALWDRGIEGLLQERVPVDSGQEGSESGAFWAAVFLASGLVRPELDERSPEGSPSSRKPRPEPRK